MSARGGNDQGRGSNRPATSLMEAICNKGMREAYQSWVRWLEDESVPSSAKCAELQAQDDQGWCPLHYAARYYCSDLLAAALDVEEVDFDVRTRDTALTPLLVAASYNRKNAVLWLLQDGRDRINVDATNSEGRNAVHLACLDLQCQYTIEPLVRQLEHLCLEKDKEGNTPLHLAASLGNLQAMESGLLNSEIWDEGAASDVEEEEGGSEGGGEGGSDEEEEGGSEGGSEEEEEEEEEEEGGEMEGGSGEEKGGSGGGEEVKEADEETGDGGSGGGEEEEEKEEDEETGDGGRGGGEEEEEKEKEEDEETGDGGRGGGEEEEEKEKEEDEETGDGGSGKRETPAKGVEKAGEEEEDAEEAGTDEWVVIAQLKKILRERNNQGRTPLHMAVENGRLEAASRLINMWPKVILEVDNEGDLPIHQACRQGNRDLVSVLLQQEISQKDIKLIQLARLSLDLKYCNKHGETPIHCAAYNDLDSGALLELLMQTCTDDIRQQTLQLRNADQYTPLMLATTHGKPEVVRVLLRHGSQATQRMDVLGENLNCLEAAIEKGKSEVARVIVDHEGWEDCLRACTTLNGVENTPFRRMIRKMPDLAGAVLTKCVTPEGSIRSDSFQLQLNFEFVQDMQESRRLSKRRSLSAAMKAASSSLLDPKESTRWPPNVYRKDNHVLAIMAEHKCEGLLQHPLVVTMLNEKWFQFGAQLYVWNLLLYVLQVLFLTAFSLSLPHPLSSSCSQHLLWSQGTQPGYTIPTVSAVAAILLGCVDLLRRFNRFLQPYRHEGQLQWYLNWGFWRDWRTYLNIQIPMLISTLLFTSAVLEECLCAAKWQWRVGTMTVFVAWIRLFFELHQFPMVGLYVEMLQKILYQFINVSLVAVVLVFSFGIPFYMAFHDPTVEDSPFGSLWYSIMTIIVFTVGGPENIMLDLDNDWSEDYFLFPVASYLLWIIFIVAMSVLFLNLLTGLAVGDVQEIRDNATVEQLAKRVKLLLDWEQTYINYRSLELPATVSPSGARARGQTGGSQLWRWLVDTVFTLEEDLYSLSTVKKLLFPEEDTEDKINWLRGTLLQLQQRSGEQERSVREGLQEVVGKLGRLLETSEELSLRQEAIEDALKQLQRKS